MTRCPAPSPTCVNDVADEHGTWSVCGQPWDGLYMDAAPFCPRCREAANAIGTGLALWISEQFAAMDAAERAAAEAA